MCIALLFLLTVWLKANQSVCTSCDVVCVSGDEKGISLRRSLQSTYLLDLVVRNDPTKKEFLAVLSVLVSCQLYLVTYGLHRQNISTTIKVENGARLLRGKKVEDLVVNRVRREWVLFDDFNNPNDE